MNFKDVKKESADRNHKNDGSTLYVSNLSSKITTAKLQDIFEKFGNIEKCYVISNPITRESRNFGFVTFNSSHEAHNALSKANKMEVEGKIINVEIAKRNEPHEPTPGEYKGVQNMMKRNGIRYDFYGKKYDRSYDKRRYESRRVNPYNKERIKNFGYRNNSYRNFEKYGRNKYNDHRNFDRRSIDSYSKYHKKNEYYRRNIRSSDDEKGYSRDEKKKRIKYERNRKSSTNSISERRRYRNSPTDRSPRYKRK